ncbi:uncharacterized protein [Paramisgurnus dabryanus]|uniref:uncharacterized protein n=1 Tax=Paramisgurnus dabryanus TaxID=90735 RepID=UPI003CCFA49A
MQTRALVYNASLRINERRRQTFKVTLCRFFTCFLYLSWVSQVEGTCQLQFNPPRVVVEYGSSVSVNCSMDATPDKIGWESNVGSVHLITDKLVTWKVSNLSKWEIRPQCYMKYNRTTACESFLPITIYKTPDSVSISTVNHTGPMIEGSQYKLQCNITEVAPRNFTVKWFKGETEVYSETFSDTIKTPVTKTSTLQITANRSDDGVQYRCEAELELGEDGPQPPPKMTSEPFNITVYFKPAINETKLPSTVSVIRGYPVRLVCEADGNPTPNISWSNGSGSRLKTTNESLTLDEVPDGDAVYTCTAVNILGKDTKKVEVFIKGIYIKQVNHRGPMIEGSQYELQCDIVNVAHVKSLTVKWFKGEKEVHKNTFNDIIKSPVNKTSTLQITANRSDNGSQYRCEAEKNVEPAAQNGSTLKSTSFTIEVYYEPVINVDKLPSQVPIFRGYPVVLSCEADGYPTPEISWTINHSVSVKGGTLNITEAASQNIVCIANNSVSSDSREVKVVLTGPQDIYIKPVNHTGPMINGSEYELQCNIVNVAPVKILTVKWFKGEKEVHNKIFKTPSVNETSILKITANRSEIGIQYICEAEMTAEPAAQNISRLISNFTVQFKPVINETKLPSEVPVFRGYPVMLTCEANGYPTPDITWKTNANNIINGENLTITEAISQNPVCIANNSFGTVRREVNVVLTEDYLPLIAGLVAITVAVISVIFIFIYSIYYKTAKMGHYTLKDTKPCTQNGKIALNGKDNTIPMKKLSKSDIFDYLPLISGLVAISVRYLSLRIETFSLLVGCPSCRWVWFLFRVRNNNLEETTYEFIFAATRCFHLPDFDLNTYNMLNSLFGLVYLSAVSLLVSLTGTQAECPVKLNPPRVFVRYDSSVSVNCSMNFTADKIGWEAQVGSVSLEKAKLITWKVPNLRQWDIRPQCYINYNRTQCSAFLPITIYKTPDSVSISTVEPLMKEYYDYEFHCDIVNVAPKKFTVKWFKGKTEVKTETFNDTIKTPVNVTSKHQFTAYREDDGARYRCEAELELGADGPQPPPKVTSKTYQITVRYRPKHEVIIELISTNHGDVTLNCTVAANPPAIYSWYSEHWTTSKNSSVLTFTTLTPGNYTCNATNPLGQSTKMFIITGDRTTFWAILSCGLVVLLLLIHLFVLKFKSFSFKIYIFCKQDFTMQTRALVYTASFRIKERRQQTFKITLCHFFISFLYLSWVLQVEGGDCPLQINPPSVVVEYGSSVSVNCSTDVTHDGIGWEAPVGPVPLTKDKLITWRVSNLRQWDIQSQCYINYNRTQCLTFLPIIIYKTPDSVSINTVNHTGPMTERSQYELQCDIVNVAPRNLTVKWFRGETEVYSETFSDTMKTPVNKTSKLQITTVRDDDGAQYRCEAELELGADGPQPPPKVTSEPLNITVYYRPKHEVTNELISTNDGDVTLNCIVAANPPAIYSWYSEHWTETRNSPVLSFSTLTPGNYMCTAINTLGKSSKVFIITGGLTTFWAILILVLMILVIWFTSCAVYRMCNLTQNSTW